MSTDWKDTSQNSGGIAYVYRLTSHDLRGNKLQFDPFHRRLTQSASADTNQCTWTCGGLHPPRLNRQQPKLSLHL